MGRFKLLSYSRIESILFEDWNSKFVFGKKKKSSQESINGRIARVKESSRVSNPCLFHHAKL